MGTVQHLILYEHITGLSLFRVKEFDEITKEFSAHPNSFIKPIAFLHYKSATEAVDNVQAIVDGRVSDLMLHFIRSNVPSSDSVLGVMDEKLGKSILSYELGFQCVWHSGVLEISRIIRQHFTRLIRSLITQPGAAHLLSVSDCTERSTSAIEINSGRIAESRARLIIGLTRARVQLDLSHHLSDITIIKTMSLLDDLDKQLVRITTRLRTCYGIHFPEVCHPYYDKRVYLKDIQLLKLVSEFPLRTMIKSSFETGLLTSCLNDAELASHVALAAQDSVGSDMNSEDSENLRLYAERSLKLIQTRSVHMNSLAKRINALCPNLNGLLDTALCNTSNINESNVKIGDNISTCLIAARLIANAGSVSRLACMPSTRVMSLGASKSLFRKSGAIAAVSTGLMSSLGSSLTSQYQNEANRPESLTKELKNISADRVKPETVRRKAARMLAAKSALAIRADCFRFHNPVSDVNKSVSEVPMDCDDRLNDGVYGNHLGKLLHKQLKSWAQSNGVHTELTHEQKEIQTKRRKMYRKNKRKQWRLRKFTKPQCIDKEQLQTEPTTVEAQLPTTTLSSGDRKRTRKTQSHYPQSSTVSQKNNNQTISVAI